MKLPQALLFPYLIAFAPLAYAQDKFIVDNTKVPSGPGIDSSSENVDFGDIDLDGDWDVGIADGGDDGNDQNRIWVNQGGLQGGLVGFFEDETAARAPAISDQSRDIEFADFDGDSDLDAAVSNTSSITVQGDRLWINLGGKQGGTLGFFADETSTRFLGLGDPGSSIPPFMVLPGGNFMDWAHDNDFGDLDNDGDLDLIHLSQGGAASGNSPSRIFLNDGNGFFTEFNPSGFQLSGSILFDGDPGLWCDGFQMNNTTDTTGAFCDITGNGEDVDVGDIDGDFDLDILLGNRDQAPRMFANRLDASGLAPAVGGGVLGFRDVTAASFPPGSVQGNGHFEQEMGDMDRDGDLDVLGINWLLTGFAYNDATYRNDGGGLFGDVTILQNSGSDDNEGDFLDYDNDGDLDIYVANFSGQDRLYQNVTGGGGIQYTFENALPLLNLTSLDADAADTDNDGDPDVLIAADNFGVNTLLVNINDVPDAQPPSIPNVESVGTAAAFPGTLPVRAQVYDNAPYYGTWYNDTRLAITVNGVAVPKLPMTSSHGQLFRGEIPGNFVGAVSYKVVSSDRYGNTGSSAANGYTATGDVGVSYGPAAAGVSTFALTELHEGQPAYFGGSSNNAGALAFLGISLFKQDPPLAPLPGLVMNIAPPFALTVAGVTDAAGDFVAVVPSLPPGTSGVTVFAQFAAFSGGLFESGNGVDIDVQP